MVLWLMLAGSSVEKPRQPDIKRLAITCHHYRRTPLPTKRQETSVIGRVWAKHCTGGSICRSDPTGALVRGWERKKKRESWSTRMTTEGSGGANQRESAAKKNYHRDGFEPVGTPKSFFFYFSSWSFLVCFRRITLPPPRSDAVV